MLALYIELKFNKKKKNWFPSRFSLCNYIEILITHTYYMFGIHLYTQIVYILLIRWFSKISKTKQESE